MTDDLFPDRTIRDHRLMRDDLAALIADRKPAHLVDCNLDEADLAKLDLSGWTFERCTMRRTDFSSARLEGTVWRSCRGAFATFHGADLSDATFLSSDLNNGMLRRATLQGVSITGCKFTGADFSEARAMEFHIAETLLINVKMPGFSFRKQTLHKVDFGQADLRKCDFRATVFEACSLRDAQLDGSRFEGADLRTTDLGGLRLIEAARFRGATISREQAGQLLGELGLNVR